MEANVPEAEASSLHSRSTNNISFPSKENIYINELLCFVSNKMNILATKDIIRLCLTTYNETEIEFARSIVYDNCVEISQLRLPNQRKNPGKSEKNMQDILRLFEETPTEKMPTFVAVNLSKLPPITYDNIDVSALLNAIQQTQTEVALLKSAVKASSEITATLNDSAALIEQRVTTLEDKHSVSRFPITEAKSSHDKPPVGNSKPVPTLAQVVSSQTVSDNNRPPVDKVQPRGHARGNIDQSPNEWIQVKPKQKRRPGVIGRANHNTLRTVVKPKRLANVFATRFDPSTSADEIHKYLVDKLNLDITVEKLNTRFDTYSSFHIKCRCDDPQVFMQEDLWPTDALIRWYREPKPKENDSGS